MSNYRIVVASWPEEEEVVAEIWFDFHFATILNHDGDLKIEFYFSKEEPSVAVLDLATVIEAITVAKSKLI